MKANSYVASMTCANALIGSLSEAMGWSDEDKQARQLIKMALATAYVMGSADGAVKMSNAWRRTCQTAEDGNSNGD